MKDKYSKKTYKQLLKDNAFLQWRFTPTPETNNYWKKLLEKDPELASEVKKADRYLKKKYFNLSSLSPEDEDLLLKRIFLTLQQKSSYKKRIIPIWVQLSITACIAIVIAIGSIIFFNRKQDVNSKKDIIVGKELISENIQLISNNKTTSFQENIDIEIDAGGLAQVKTTNKSDEKIAVNVRDFNTLIVPYGKRSTLTLADGSKVWLNSGSVLEFPTQFSGDNREIRLESGEMYIEVMPYEKKTFYVHTSDFNVKVYGTKFNVSNYSGSTHSVVLVEGSVSLESAANKEVFLSPSEQAVYSDDGTFKTQKVNVNQYISWKNGYLEFDNAPMADVLEQIARYYNLSFEYDKDVSLKDLTCNGIIILSENLDNVMTALALISSTKYKKEDNKIYITNDSH